MEVFDPVNETNNAAAIYTETSWQLIVSASQDALEAISEARSATTRAFQSHHKYRLDEARSYASLRTDERYQV